jgi:hypothetical protein
MHLNVHLTRLEFHASPCDINNTCVCFRSGLNLKIHHRHHIVVYQDEAPIYDCYSLFVDLSRIFLKLSSALSLDTRVLALCRVSAVRPKKFFTFELRVKFESRKLYISAETDSKHT